MLVKTKSTKQTRDLLYSEGARHAWDELVDYIMSLDLTKEDYAGLLMSLSSAVNDSTDELLN